MIDWNDIEVALFDLDGVITPTALVHQAAWKQMFDAFLGRWDGDDFEPFTEEDYLRFVDGKPREAGIRSFLDSRSIDLADADAEDSVAGLAEIKNQAFNDVLTRDGVEPYPDAVELLNHLAPKSTRLAVVSSSANAVNVLRRAGLRARFEFVMDGHVARQRGLAGKPEPDTFLAAAAELGSSPGSSIVFEDAVSGVQAGRAGGFAVVYGVDRTGSGEALSTAGADVVVTDLRVLIAAT